MQVSVVIPVYNGARTLPECLGALRAQQIPSDRYEVIVVDDGSTDGTPALARQFPVRLLQQERQGSAAARNTGLSAALGNWVAFTDADCIPSRAWLRALLDAVEPAGGPHPLGAAGRVVGHESHSRAARFVDLTGGLDAERCLAHPQFPFAPTANVMYRRDVLLDVGGFDRRFSSYDACDLHCRLRRRANGPFPFVSRALVLHRHRATWRAYWRQQFWYGRGYGQFLWHHRAEVPWSLRRELTAWRGIGRLALAACRGGGEDDSLISRGMLVKDLAQRLGVLTTYWNPVERARW